MPFFKRKPQLSIVVIFYNMRREAVRTLYSLTTRYQRNIEESDYEVIVMDSNSSEPLDREWVEGLQDNFSYRYIEADAPTPCKALNQGARMAQADTVVSHIDGARILSPGVLHYMLGAKKAFDHPFTYTIGMHLGHKRQGISVSEGYNQIVEDELLETVPWQEDGYRLFDVACLAGSSKEGYLYPVYESNCFAIEKTFLTEIGGFDEAFTTLGGGLVNLDMFRKLMQHPATTPVMLIGEGSFHQFHGGVSTNVPAEKNPWAEYDKEYERLRGTRFEFIGYPEQPVFLGRLERNSRRFFYSEREVEDGRQHGK